MVKEGSLYLSYMKYMSQHEYDDYIDKQYDEAVDKRLEEERERKEK